MTANEALYALDTNVFVSALLLDGSVAQRALAKALNTGKLVHSLATLAELKEVLERKKFDKYLTLEERMRFLVSLMRETVLIDIEEEIIVCRDPKDDKFLELAVNGQVKVLISGDKDLLSLHPFRPIPILSPAEFLSDG